MRLARDLILNPAKALDRIIKEKGSLAASSRIYFLYLVTAVIFYTFKPQDFPPLPADAPFLRSDGGLFFWMKVHAWNPLFTAIGIAFVGVFARLLNGGRLMPRMFASALCCALPVLLLLAYTNSVVNKPIFALGWAALLSAAGVLFRDRRLEHWMELVGVFLSVNVVALAALPLFLLTIAGRWAQMYHNLEVGMMFWILGLATYGVSRVTGLQKARAFCAIFLATLCQIFFIFSLHLLGIIPKEALKALMTV